MNAGSRDGRYISECIFGQQTGATVMRTIEAFAANPDELFRHVCAAIDEGDASRARLQGFCRAIQKVVEQRLEATR